MIAHLKSKGVPILEGPYPFAGTRAVMIEDLDGTRRVVDALVGLGVGIALDDFGTGYSSLSHVHTFPLNQLKIDRSFVGRLGESASDAALIGSVIHADRFGNLVTNVTVRDLERLSGTRALDRIEVRVAGRKISGGLASTYGDRRRGALLALVGSSGRLEIARRDASAAALFRYRRGRLLVVRCVSADRG